MPTATVDLNGHTIAGRFDGYSCNTGCLGKNGIDNGAGHDGVVIERDDSLVRPRHPLGGRSSLGALSLDDRCKRSDRLHAGRHLHVAVAAQPGAPHHAVQLIDGSDGNVLVRNGIEAAGVALVVRGSRRNVFAGNAFETGRSPVVTLSVANGNALRANTVLTDGPSWGIRLDGNRNLIGENTIAEAYNGGIEVRGAWNSIRANDLRHSGIHGIDVDAPGTPILQNVVNDNGGLGIEAVAGVTDLGGNMASGNGNPLQCQNVF